MKLGVDPIAVGEYTPYEIILIGKQRQEYQTQALERSICLAWHTEAFARTKRLPKLKDAIKAVRKPKRKTNSRSDEILKAMARAKGVDL